jgi:hypothetical protein
MEFENDYGAYPDAATLVTITETFATSALSGAAGADSNGYFLQLFQANITQSEAMFYAKARGTKKPDGDISTNTEALKEGEVGFSYILDGTDGMSSAGNPARVLVATPMATATSFDGDPFDRKAVVLRIDNSVTSLNIAVPAASTDNSGPAITGGEDLLASTNPIWGNTTPTAILPLGAVAGP